MTIMDELRHLISSFGYALSGIGYGIRTQRNLRIHLVALATVIVFNAMAGLSVIHWCIELLCCMLVISLELVNTALEAACDRVSTQQHPLLGHAKDAAAGAVLVAAVGSVVIALLIFCFGNGAEYRLRLEAVLAYYAWVKYALAAGAVVGILFIFLPSILQQQKKK